MVPAPTFLAGGVLYPPSIFWSLPFIPNVLYANVFTMLPSGALMSLATNALLNLCAPHGWDLGDVQTGDTGDAAAAAAAETWKDAPLVCTGTEAGAAQDQAHKLLLRSVVPTARFAVRRAQ